MFKLFDRENCTLALRHEMTTPIARVAASRLKDSELPLKLSYIASVFRLEQVQTGRQCEFRQAGVELLGAGGVAADAVVVALAVEAVQSAGLEEFTFCLGQVDLIRGVMERYELSVSEQEAIKAAMERHDLVELNRLVDSTSLPVDAQEVLKKLPI